MANGKIILEVRDVATGNILTQFNYIVNENNVGDPQIDKPEPDRNPTMFPSLKPAASYSQVITTGAAIGLSPIEIKVPEGKYLISILSSGYKMGGAWVQVIAGSAVSAEVLLTPNPLPLSKIRVHVFHDNNPVNGEDDFPLENGLEGFLIIIGDTVGEVTVDYFGNPLGTEYERNEQGDIIFDSFGNPIPIPNTGGRILSDSNGNALIDNLPPGKYEVQIIPPNGSDWIQTTTIEGTRIIDVWIEEGNDGYSPREGFQMPLVWVGFIKPMEFPEPFPWETGIIKGRIRTIIEFTPPFRPLTLGDPVDRPWISLCDIGGNDQQVYTGRGDGNGDFIINNVPAGTYQMAIWDEPLDYIISFRTITIGVGEIIDMGDIGVPRWFGYIKGTVFNDINENGMLDQGETGVPNVEVLTRFKDGSIQYSTVTDMRGNYFLKEVFELERFAVIEVGFTRFARTGATAYPDYGITTKLPLGSPVPPNACLDNMGDLIRCPETFPGALTLAELTWAAKTNRIDWGKRPYQDGENGGISGIVYYATMRNETDPRFEAAEPYEPGVPLVTINLYSTLLQNGKIILHEKINSVTTDPWEHPTGCNDENGNPIPCLEVPNSSNQIRPGVFDGGYAFETDEAGNPLTPGIYIVEINPPEGYKAINEHGSVNTEGGDQFVPKEGMANLKEVLIQQSPDTTRVDMRVNPAAYYKDPITGQIDIHKKVAIIVEKRNTSVDFFVFTDVPVPGRIIGFLLDDVNLETDPNLIYYGEKRGIPNTPVGIRDFTGRLITTIHSDTNGVFEVLLPSTYTRNVPTPSGVVPGMYLVVANDPGNPDHPNSLFNPNYQTLVRTFDVWPGKTTYADMATFPITAFVEGVGSQFSQPPVCKVPNDTPQVFRLSRIHANVEAINDTNRELQIFGTGFGIIQGTVTLGGDAIEVLSWNDFHITARVPLGFANIGPVQLMVTNSLGNSCPIGVTFHVRKQGEYWPDIVRVRANGTGDFATIQNAIDNVAEGTLIVVFPGIYYENIILYKNVKLQSVGPGGIRSNGQGVSGAVIDGRFFLANEQQWLEKINEITFDGAELVPEDQVKEITKGQVITVVARAGQFSHSFNPQIDGFMITGARGEDGGVYVNAHCNYLEISNNIIQSNGGGFGGGITIGKAYVGSNFNDDIYIHHNRVLNNGGISLAGGIGIFNGASRYILEYNHICGNYSAEYGGGISHYGYSSGGTIHHNMIEFNASFDEGGGIFIGGEQPTPPELLTKGTGEVTIYNNLISGNLANDDGGGIRLLQPRDYRITIFNNMIVNNVSTDLGGGIALDDASNVVIMNNTIAKNITTATAEDSDGMAHGAGLVSEMHSQAFRATLPPGEPDFSNPILFNNIFWDNRAGVYNQSLNNSRGGIYGIGNYGEEPNVIDMEVFGTPQLEFLHPQYCTLSAAYPPAADPNENHNIIVNPKFVQEYNVKLDAVAFNMEPDFRSVKIITVTPENLGDCHILSDSLAIGAGAAQVEGILAPDYDYDNEPRPTTTGYDIGADQYKAQ